MPDRRQVLRALLVGAAGAALPAGCGIPTGGAPKTYGAGPAYDPIGSGNSPAPVPDGATTPTRLVELFMGAVSGLLDNESIKEAHNRANAFLTPEAAARWKPTDDVFVLRVTDLTSSTGANTIVSCTVQPVGRLMRDSTVQFTVTNTATGYRISELPALAPSNGLPLAVDALTSYYTPQLIYFWDASKSWLVPELRYVPHTVAMDAQLTQIVNWLLPGPGDPVTSTVTTSLIPSNTGVVGRVTLQGSQVTVPFSAALQGGDLQRILV